MPYATKDEIISKTAERLQYFGPLRSQMENEDKYIEGTFLAGIPENLGYKQRTPPTASEWIDVGINIYTADNPHARMWPRGSTPEDEERDSKCEDFCNLTMKAARIEIREHHRKQLSRGMSVLSPYIDWRFFGKKQYRGEDFSRPVWEMSDKELKAFKEYERQRLFHFPVRIRAIDPLRVLPSPVIEDMIPEDVIEYYQMTVAAATHWAKSNGLTWTSNKKDTTLVPFHAFTSATEIVYLLDKEVVYRGANPYGFVNYLIVPSGYGQRDWECRPEKLYRSIISKRKDMLKMEARALSMLDALNARQAFQNVKLIGEENDVEVLYPDRKVSLNPNDVIREIPDKVMVDILKGDAIPPGLFDELAILQQKAQPPVALAGGRPTGVYSGEHQELIAGFAKSLYKEPFKLSEIALAIACGMALRMA